MKALKKTQNITGIALHPDLYSLYLWILDLIAGIDTGIVYNINSSLDEMTIIL